MKQPDERAAFRIKSTQVRTLVCIAVIAGESEVLAVVPSAMLSSNDVLDVIGEERLRVLRKAIVFAAGRKAEDGRIDDRYNLIELSTSSYPARTRRNIEKSDGTVIFSLERALSGGTRLTSGTCQQAREAGAEHL